MLTVVLPIGVAFMLPLLGRVAPRLRAGAAGLATLCTLVFALSMTPRILGGEVLVYHLGGWSPAVGINLVVDGLGLILALLSSFLAFLVMIYSVGYMPREKALTNYYTLLLILLAGMNGFVLTGDIFNMFVFLEVMSIASYGLVAYHGRRDDLEASFKFQVISTLGTLLLLLGVATIYSEMGTLNMALIASHEEISTPTVFATALILIGFGVKAALIPLHAWLPDAYSEAPSPISAVFAGIMTKAGVYGIIRLLYTMLGLKLGVVTYLTFVGLATLVFGGVMALVQTNLKRLLAYSSISQMGYVIMAMSFGTRQGLQGGIFHLINHGIMKALLFFCAGAIIFRTGKKDLDELGGLSRKMPVTATCFIIGALAASGIPPFNGFLSKWTIFSAGLGANMVFATIVAIMTNIVTLAYFLRAIQKVFFGPPTHRNLREAPPLLLIPMVSLALLCLLLGLFPETVLALVETAIGSLLTPSRYVQAVLGGGP